MPGTIAVINGPNLNLLGTREPDIYGHETLHDIEKHLARLGEELDIEIECFQSNHEGRLIDHIHALRGRTAFIIINPGGLTHTSVSLRDALSAVSIPFIEVHLTNVHAREAFRRHSYLSDLAVGVISGLGAFGYEAALRAAAARLSR